MRRRALVLVLALAACFAPLVAAPPAGAAAAMPPIGHVFIIVLENESESTTFGAGSPAPYLAQTLTSEGAFLPNYYGIGHNSNDNYIAMISGQAPNPQTQADCQIFDNFEPDMIGSYGQAVGQGCVFPSEVQTIANQLDSVGLTWRDYNQGMGTDPSREASVCGHPDIGGTDNTESGESAAPYDEYATRHNPFVYFHSIIDNTTECDNNVVNLNQLPQDLATASSTPNYIFITPDLCGDGHDSPCKDPSRQGGFGGIEGFLQQWVPTITSSPAFKQNGLLIITFDEGEGDDTSCCGEIAGPNSPSPGGGGPGGGDVGAVLLSPCIAPGTVSMQPYNHYSMLGSVEDIFGLPMLGYAQLPGEDPFGSDVFTGNCGTAPAAHISAPSLASSTGTRPRVTLRWGATGSPQSYTVLFKGASAGQAIAGTLLNAATRTSIAFTGKAGWTYQFSVRATGSNGGLSPLATATTVIPSGVHPTGGKYHGAWHVRSVRGAWEGQAIAASKAGASFSLSYVGGSLAIIGEKSPGGGRARITIDGKSHTISLHAGTLKTRVVLLQASLASASHTLQIKVLGGTVALEGLAITSRTA